MPTNIHEKSLNYKCYDGKLVYIVVLNIFNAVLKVNF